MTINWAQVGEDFKQKFDGCFVKYESPLTKRTDIFRILAVDVYPNKPPSIMLFNDTAGEIHLQFTTEAELDFSFPECGYSQDGNKALIFRRRYNRQWKKGLSDATVLLSDPYTQIYNWGPRLELTEQVVKSAFYPDFAMSISEALKRLKDGVYSVAINRSFALGLANKSDEHWLWFDHAPIATVTKDTVKVQVPEFEQEIRDLIRTTEDYGRFVV